MYSGVDGGRLSVEGSHFYKDGERVFLSGTNQAWVNYGHDFGNNQYSKVRRNFSRILDELHEAGGNSVRTFRRVISTVIHCLLCAELSLVES